MEKILNITACLSPEIEPDWIKTAVRQYIPLVIENGATSVEIIEVIPSEQTADQGITYTIQLRFEDEKSLKNFRQNHEQSIESQVFSRYGQNMLTFRLELNSIHKSPQ